MAGRPEYRRFGFVDFDAFGAAELVAGELGATDEIVVRQSGGDNVIAQIQDIPTGGGVPDPLLLGNGSAAAPSYSYTADPDTGVFRAAADTLGFSAGGVLAGQAFETGGVAQMLANIGSASAPGWSFIGDPDTGIYGPAANRIGFAVSGVGQYQIIGTTFAGQVVGSAAIQNVVPSGTVPNIFPRGNDADTGIGSVSADQLSLIAGGVEGARVQTVGIRTVDGSAAAPSYSFITDPDTGIFSSSANTLGIALGGASNYAFTTVQFTNGLDGATMVRQVPTATLPAYSVKQTDTDTGIGTAAADQLSLIAGGVEGLRVTEAAAAISSVEAFGPILLPAGSAAAPSLSFSAEPDMGFFRSAAGRTVWAEGGVARFEFDDANGGIFQSENSGGPGLRNVAATGIGPTVLPVQGDVNTGLGQSANDALTLIAGGVAGIDIVENVTVAISLLGETTITGNFLANQGAGPGFLNEDASSTNPTLVPNQADPDTGIGRDAVDGLALIAGAVDCLRVREIGGARAVGFYTTTPIIQQTGVAVTAAGIHAACVALGLFTA